MTLKSNVSVPPLTGGFRFGHRGYSSCLKAELEPRKRIGTTVSEATYEELARLADRYQLRLSQILDEATASGLIASAVEILIEQR